MRDLLTSDLKFKEINHSDFTVSNPTPEAREEEIELVETDLKKRDSSDFEPETSNTNGTHLKKVKAAETSETLKQSESQEHEQVENGNEQIADEDSDFNIEENENLEIEAESEDDTAEISDKENVEAQTADADANVEETENAHIVEDMNVIKEELMESLGGQNVYEYVMKILEEEENEPGVVYDEDGEMYIDEEMSMEEMRAKLPDYYFKTPKQKKKYFKKLTSSYKKKLRKSQIHNDSKENKRIGFALERNRKRVFAKHEKLQ